MTAGTTSRAVDQRAQVLLAEVRDANRARTAVRQEGLGGPVGADGVLEVLGHGLMEQVQIDVVQTILLASPIWNIRAPMIVTTFTERYDFTRKTVLPSPPTP